MLCVCVCVCVNYIHFVAVVVLLTNILQILTIAEKLAKLLASLTAEKCVMTENFETVDTLLWKLGQLGLFCDSCRGGFASPTTSTTYSMKS